MQARAYYLYPDILAFRQCSPIIKVPFLNAVKICWQWAFWILEGITFASITVMSNVTSIRHCCIWLMYENIPEGHLSNHNFLLASDIGKSANPLSCLNPIRHRQQCRHLLWVKRWCKYDNGIIKWKNIVIGCRRVFHAVLVLP